MALVIIQEAVSKGCRKFVACKAVGMTLRTIQRWIRQPQDQRRGPLTAPSNKLTIDERELIIKTSISAEFRNLSPHQIVPKLADTGVYIASESSFYRVLKSEKLNAHRGHSKPRLLERPRALEAV